MNSIISDLILAFCIAALLVVLIQIAMKFIGFMAKAIAKEPCKVSIAGELIFAFIFAFFIVLFFLI